MPMMFEGRRTLRSIVLAAWRAFADRQLEPQYPVQENTMDPRNYSRLAAVIFAIIAVLQLIRVVLA